MEKVSVDSFELEVESPSILRVTWTGELTPKALQALGEYAKVQRAALGQQGEDLDLLIDAREATSFGREARREVRELTRNRVWKRIAIIGVRLEVKVVLEMLLKALRLVNDRVIDVRFMDTEAEAMAWFTD